MRNVTIFCERFLPFSQSFIATQMDFLTRYQPRVLATGLVDNDHSRRHVEKCTFLPDSRRGKLEELVLKTAGVSLPSLKGRIADTDLVHAHFGKNGYVIAPLARAAGKPLVTTFHGFDATYSGPALRVKGLNQKRFFAGGRRAMASGDGWQIAVSRFIEAKLLSLGFPRERVFRHYIGIDLSRFPPSQTARRPCKVVSVARFVEYKGHRFMIDALSRVARGGIPVELVMVGEGPLRAEIERLARASLPHVEVREKQTPDEIRQLLSEAELYVHSAVTLDNGHAEAFGIANLEAAAVGTPVVAFDSGGIGEAVEHDRTGLLCAERDVEQLAENIARILGDRDTWQGFSRNATRFVADNFDARRQTGLLEDIYDEVIRRHRGAL